MFVCVLLLCSQRTQPAQKEAIELAANLLATDNVDLASVFIQKTAIEKALPEIDKRLAAVSARLPTSCCWQWCCWITAGAARARGEVGN